ncbi:phosphoadenylyl-sulfate reductase [Neolewinella antarctica]|uniref:Adenosine 5'-phosphosulfate reductase n=1 Tax=Neolewinella antarctica TaxID=442734 RepID=A0ABX0X9E0_9BACT|nr:phosphoadenylyl-sulfate reductase [Neolewinella antarctica]NJC25856.1 phosphoadenosine phosphosulfate reductase [Neolewinella antarctica]
MTAIPRPILKVDIEALNAEFEHLTFEERFTRLYERFPVDEVLFTSSFGTKSVVMLTFVSRANARQKVHMLNTGYHFPETLIYKNTLSEVTGLEVVEILPDPARHRQTLEAEMWDSQPSRCCHYNKVMPLAGVKAAHTVWMSGVHSYQTMNRAAMRIFEAVDGLIHFHPLIDITEGEFLYYLEKDQLPRHPLEAQGYGSIGCHHCTHPGQGRAGRWVGKERDECGLHT